MMKNEMPVRPTRRRLPSPLAAELFPPQDMECLAAETKLAWGDERSATLTRLSPA